MTTAGEGSGGGGLLEEGYGMAFFETGNCMPIIVRWTLRSLLKLNCQ